MATRKTTTPKAPIKRATAARTSRATKTAPAAVKQQATMNGVLLSWSLVLYLGLAMAAGLLMTSDTLSITLTHLTSDLLLSQSTTTFITATKPLISLELRWLIVGLMVISAMTPLLYLTRLKDYYATGITKRKFVGLRWVDLAVSSAVMIEILAVLGGYSDLMTLKLIGALLGATCALSWIAEKQNASGRTTSWNAFGLAIFTGAMPWLAIGMAHIATLLYGNVRSPWYVYAACFSTLVGFCLLGIAQYRRYRFNTDYLKADRQYLMWATLTKVSFTSILILGLMK